MSTYFRDIQKHVVTSGNFGIATAGQTLFTRVGTGRNARLQYVVSPGQLVAYTVSGGVATTQDDSTLTAAMIPNLFIGVGHDSLGVGYTTDILHIGIEGISGCLPERVSTSSPHCGAPQVVDFYFDCTQCDETYSVMVGVDDNSTRSYAPFNKSFAEYVGSIVTQCHSCDSCPVEHNCKEVACKLADSLNGEVNLRIGNEGYPDWRGLGMPRPYFATRLHENSFLYCFAAQTEEGGCQDCTFLDLVKGVLINGVRYDFIGNTNTADVTQTLPSQLDGIAAQINDQFIEGYGGDVTTGVNPHAGSAYITGTFQPCCGIQLHVNTCDANFALYDINDAVIDPVDGYPLNPFTTYGTSTASNNCVDCADVAVAARGVLTGTTIANADTVTIDGKVYTFETVLTNVDGHVLVGLTDSASLDNLVDAINLGGGVGVTYATATTLHPTVSAVAGTGDTVIVTAKTAGTAGNSIATIDGLTAGGFAAVTLLGGLDAATPATTDYTCGIRVIAEQIKGGCGCYVNQPLAFYGRRIFVNPIGDAWRGKPYRVVEVQAMELPAGFGSWIQWLELQNIPEGKGRDYERVNRNAGWANIPDKRSRINNAVHADCSKNYCSYFLETLTRKRNLNNEFGYLTIDSNVHIPTTDSNTITDWEDLFTALIELNPACNVLTVTACQTDIAACGEELD